MVTTNDILDTLRTIDDPEMPINIVDLGIVDKVQLQRVLDPEAANVSHEEGESVSERVQVSVDILPTFVGCPALPVIEDEIHRRVAALPGVAGVNVHICYAPPWSVDRITAAGRESLRRHGVTVPMVGDENVNQSPSCPFCGAMTVRQESAFGPTRCRTIWYCDSCRHPFEHLKRLPNTGLIDLSLQRLGRSF
jgi:ring-1,2-phenylacetyl-CoA epoxidase subunit PaaD